MRAARGLWRVGLVALVGAVSAAPSLADTTSPSDSSCPSTNPPNTLALMGGTPQTAPLDGQFASPLQVALANTDGCPVTGQLAGTPVTFTAPASGASGVFASSGSSAVTVGTDSTGAASAGMLSANDTAGGYTVTATSAYGTVSFALANTAAGIPAAVVALAPTSEQAAVDGRYAQPLSARVLDADGNPVVGATVTFTLGSAGGGGNGGGSSAGASPGATFADGTATAMETTGSDGVATSPGVLANGAIGSFTATAATPRVTDPAVFTLENVAGRSSTFSTVGSSRLTGRVGSRYRRRLEVRLRAADGQPVVGATVAFTLGVGGAGGAAGAGATFATGGSQATAVTGVRGIATSPAFAANRVAGSFTALASVSGQTASFALRNEAGAATTLTAGVAASESTTAGTRFAIPLAITATDANGNRVAGVRVTFTAPADGASGTFAGRARSRRVVVRTDDDGVAVAPSFTANGQAGGYLVVASAGRARRAAFALVNEAP